MRLNGKLALLAVFALPLAAASIQGTKPEEVGFSSERLHRIHDTVEHHMASHDVTGAVTLVARRGRTAHWEAQGVMDLESQKPMAKDTLFWIASMSKPITGVAILMLMEEGKVRLNDPISKFVPEFRGMKVAVMEERHGAVSSAPPKFYTVPANREITIQDLLTHVSGLVSGGPSVAEAAKYARKPGETLADYIPRLGATPLDFQPGSQWHYSPGAAFDTLGRVVEIVSGQPFDKFLRQRIFEPLGMKDIYFHPPDDRVARIVTNYHREGGALHKVDGAHRLANTTYFSGAGGLITDAEDYLQFAQMLLNGGQLCPASFGTPSTNMEDRRSTTALKNSSARSTPPAKSFTDSSPKPSRRHFSFPQIPPTKLEKVLTGASRWSMIGLHTQRYRRRKKMTLGTKDDSLPARVVFVATQLS